MIGLVLEKENFCGVIIGGLGDRELLVYVYGGAEIILARSMWLSDVVVGIGCGAANVTVVLTIGTEICLEVGISLLAMRIWGVNG